MWDVRMSIPPKVLANGLFRRDTGVSDVATESTVLRAAAAAPTEYERRVHRDSSCL